MNAPRPPPLITISSWLSSLRSMAHQEFRALLRSILQAFLKCIEGLQTLNSNFTLVIEGIRFVVRV
jgi:hypothetical protein